MAFFVAGTFWENDHRVAFFEVVGTLENGFQLAMLNEDVDNLYQTNMWLNNVPLSAANIRSFVGNLGRTLQTSGFENGANMAYYTNKGRNVRLLSGQQENRFQGNGDVYPIIMKNGAVVFIRIYNNANQLTQNLINNRANAGTSYYTNAADIFIDVNGAARPNIIGRDIFAYEMSEAGVLYPLGGTDVNIVDDVALWNAAEGEHVCTDAAVNNRTSDGYACAGRIAANGGRIDY